MFESDDKFNPKPLQNDSQRPDYQNIDANISQKSVAFRKKQLEGIFFKLIVFGLSLGMILGIGTFYLLKKLGLTEKPYHRQERINPSPEKPPSLQETKTFLRSPKSFKI